MMMAYWVAHYTDSYMHGGANYKRCCLLLKEQVHMNADEPNCVICIIVFKAAVCRDMPPGV